MMQGVFIEVHHDYPDARHTFFSGSEKCYQPAIAGTGLDYLRLLVSDIVRQRRPWRLAVSTSTVIPIGRRRVISGM